MAVSQSTQLAASVRDDAGSRATRRLRREGKIPGVVYGGGREPQAICVDGRALRLALAHAGAVLELAIDGDRGAPVVLKDTQRHPVGGETLHIDLLRVRLDQAIQAVVALELAGADESPGATEGGVLEQVTRELNVEALPTDIPDVVVHDVSGIELNETLTLAAIAAPSGVTLLDDPEETVIATMSIPRLQPEPDEEIEQETELVGAVGQVPVGEPAEGEPASDPGGEAEGEAPAEG